MTCARSGDSDQPGHPPSLIGVFTVRTNKLWVEPTAKIMIGLIRADWAHKWFWFRRALDKIIHTPQYTIVSDRFGQAKRAPLFCSSDVQKSNTLKQGIERKTNERQKQKGTIFWGFCRLLAFSWSLFVSNGFIHLGISFISNVQPDV